MILNRCALIFLYPFVQVQACQINAAHAGQVRCASREPNVWRSDHGATEGLGGKISLLCRPWNVVIQHLLRSRAKSPRRRRCCSQKTADSQRCLEHLSWIVLLQVDTPDIPNARIAMRVVVQELRSISGGTSKLQAALFEKEAVIQSKDTEVNAFASAEPEISDRIMKCQYVHKIAEVIARKL